MIDILVERCRRAGEQLIKQLGGLDGLFRKAEAMDRRRAREQAARRAKRRQTARSPKQVRKKATVRSRAKKAAHRSQK
jgi:hypothetical protein